MNDAAIASERQNLVGQRPWLDKLPLRRGASILDIGAGPGYHCDYFGERGLLPVACDRFPETFLFRDRIPLVRSIEELRDRKFDYVFASHVLEHQPDTFTALTAWRTLLVPEGSILIIVPPYVPEPTDDHWNIGWNIGQLALLLVAAGFDCSRSLFLKTGHNICGMGMRRDIPPTYCNIAASLPYLPRGLAEARFTSGPNSHLPGAVCRADAEICEPDLGASQQHFPLSGRTRLTSLAISPQHSDWELCCYDRSIPLPDPMLLVCFNDGEVSLALRLAVGSEASDWQNCAEKYFHLKPGLSCVWFQRSDFSPLRGNVDFEHIDRLAFGGIGPPTPIRFALFDRSGHQLFVSNQCVH